MGQLLGLILLCSGMMSLCYAALLIKCAMSKLCSDSVITTQVLPSKVITQVCGPALSRMLCSQQFSYAQFNASPILVQPYMSLAQTGQSPTMFCMKLMNMCICHVFIASGVIWSRSAWSSQTSVKCHHTMIFMRCYIYILQMHKCVHSSMGYLLASVEAQ